MATDTEKFLEAEQAVHELLENLGELKKEIESYSEAGKSFKESNDHIGHLATSITDLNRKTADVVQTLSQIGTPAILAKIEEVQKAAHIFSTEQKQKSEEISLGILETQNKNRLVFTLLIVNVVLTIGAIIVGLR
jgi:hypothetical protein